MATQTIGVVKPAVAIQTLLRIDPVRFVGPVLVRQQKILSLRVFYRAFSTLSKKTSPKHAGASNILVIVVTL